MYKIAQGDIFRYLNQRSGDGNAYHTQEQIAEIFSEVFQVKVDKSGINRILKGKDRGRTELDMKKMDAFFDALFPEVKQVGSTKNPTQVNAHKIQQKK